MQWEVINIDKQPRCDFCGYTTQQMARFNALIRPDNPVFICELCAVCVKECLNKWNKLEPDPPGWKPIGCSTEYLEVDTDSHDIDHHTCP